jgi:hypothetical protein
MPAAIATPAQMAAKWLAGMQNGGQKWAQGCSGTNKNLFELALAQAPQAAINFGKAVSPGGAWHNAMTNGQMATWKQACSAAATAGRFAQGGQKGQAKYLKFANNAQPVYQQMRAAAGAAQGPIAKVSAALNVLIAAGKKNGSNSLAANS